MFGERTKPLERRTPLRQRKPIGRDAVKLEEFRRRGAEAARASGFTKPRPVAPTSREQRAKVKAAEVCRILAAHEHDFDAGTVPAEVLRAIAAWTGGRPAIDPMHVIDRSIGGCDDALCVINGARPIHAAYDRFELSILPYLTLPEQAHAAAHVGIARALVRVTGTKAPTSAVVEPEADRLPWLTYDEQAVFVAELGLLDAFEHLAGEPWIPDACEVVA